MIEKLLPKLIEQMFRTRCVQHFSSIMEAPLSPG